MAAAKLEQEMGRRSVTEDMRPTWDRAVASSSSDGGLVTKQMVAEACDTLSPSPVVRPERPSAMRARPEDRGVWG